ncbi:MAG: kynureninase [Paracoccaceae bacterium]
MTHFAKTKAMFHLPDGMIYLDGNSLGPLPKAAVERVRTTMQDEWGEMLITGWNKAGWMEQTTTLADRIGRLIGAPAGSMVLGDTLSIKVYQALASALELRPQRKVILSDTGNFPSDLYMADGLIRSLKQGHVLKTVAPEDVAANINQDVAVLMLTEVGYGTGRMHDMAALTKLAHDAGALTVWDLAHSAGAIPVDVTGTGADFAVGCTYKYLNSGPGGPAFIYVAPEHADTARPALSGWLGHEAPFAFDPDYRPGQGIQSMRVGTPPVLQLASLSASLDIWDQVDMQAVRARSSQLTQLFIELVERSCPMLKLASPRDPSHRGSQVCFAFEQGYAVMQALIARGVIGDFRAPDIMRFGFTPLYIDADDVRAAVAILADIMATDAWDTVEFKTKSKVT